MSEHIVENNPKKEFLFALGGVALFLGIVLLIGISGYFRPAGEHITAESTEATAETEATATEAAPAATAEATVTPTDTDGTVVAAESGTATAEGTVNQAAVPDDANLTAEEADADLDGGEGAELTHTWKTEE